MTNESCPACRASIQLGPYDSEIQCPACLAWWDVHESPAEEVTLTARAEAPPVLEVLQ